uniref:U1 small nuclear ribonucleoprotein C n=1 Tax=Cebus imitator TaxID=2715852 RepID=A0A2K5QP12_CEBIM
MPKFYCDYCDTYITYDSPSVRKTHCSGRKHKENVKDDYQKWMEEQTPPTPFSVPPPAGAMTSPPPSLPGPPRPGMMPAPHMGGPPMMPMMVGRAPGMRPPMGGHMPMMPGPPVMRPPARPMMVPTLPRMTRPTDKDSGEASFYQFYLTCSASPGDHAAVMLGFLNSIRKTCSPVRSKRIVLEGRGGAKKMQFSFVLGNVKIKLSTH